MDGIFCQGSWSVRVCQLSTSIKVIESNSDSTCLSLWVQVDDDRRKLGKCDRIGGKFVLAYKAATHSYTFTVLTRYVTFLTISRRLSPPLSPRPFHQTITYFEQPRLFRNIWTSTVTSKQLTLKSAVDIDSFEPRRCLYPASSLIILTPHITPTISLTSTLSAHHTDHYTDTALTLTIALTITPIITLSITIHHSSTVTIITIAVTVRIHHHRHYPLSSSPAPSPLQWIHLCKTSMKRSLAREKDHSQDPDPLVRSLPRSPLQAIKQNKSLQQLKSQICKSLQPAVRSPHLLPSRHKCKAKR